MIHLRKLTFLPPFLFACFPVLYLITHNIHEIPFSAGLRSLILAVLLAAMVLMLSLVVFRHLVKAAWIATLIIGAFFLYGHLYRSLKGTHILGFTIARHRVLVPFMMAAVLVAIFMIIRRKNMYEQLTAGLNLLGLLLIASLIIQLGYIRINTYFTSRRMDTNSLQQIITGENNSLPDIYYLILDGYPRGDVLLESFNYDNGPFLSWLESRGFFIASCSQSNYSYTKPAMASTFNLTYLGNNLNHNEITVDDAELNVMLKNSLVQQTVRELEYSIITFETGYKWLNWDQPDQLYSINDDIGQYYQLDSDLNNFELLLLETTAASIFIDQFDIKKLLEKSPRQVHQEKILYTFDKLMEIPALEGPKFIYAHIVSPHPPFIFGPNGQLLVNKPVDEIAGYRGQVDFINNRLTEIISEIIANSPTPPIIILQGDHGAVIDYENTVIDPMQKLAILNALFLPGIDDEIFYARLSPVNTFALIFNHYFDADYPLLDDLSIYGNQSPYQQLPCPISQD